MIALLFAARALGGGILGAGSAIVDAHGVPSETHGWIVVPDGDSSVVFHAPPRRAAVGAGGVLEGASDGEVRSAARVPGRIEAIAAWQNRVYLLQAQEAGFPNGERRLNSIAAVKSSFGSVWLTSPAGRLEAHASLPGGGRVLGFVVTARGPMVLIDGGIAIDRGTARALDTTEVHGPRLLMLADGEWRVVPLPADFVAWARGRALGDVGSSVNGAPDVSAGCSALVADARGVELFAVERGGMVRSWRADAMPPATARRPTTYRPTVGERIKATREAAGETNAPGLEWREQGVSEMHVEGTWPTIVRAGGARLAVVRAGTSVQVLELLGTRWDMLAEVADVGSGSALMPLDGSGRMALAWGNRGGAAPAQHTLLPTREQDLRKVVESITPEVWEGSAFTGRAMYVGRARIIAPVSAADYRLLAIVLVGVMAMALAFVLRTETDDSIVVLPEGAVLAEPGRRAVATLIDALVAITLTSNVMGAGLAEVFTVEGLLLGKGLVMLVVSLGVGAVIGSVAEAVFGRTVGKLLTACEVVDARSGVNGNPLRPRMFASVMRNAIKWALPPLTMLAITDRFGRHLPDRLARTAVIVWDDEVPEAEEAGPADVEGPNRQ